MATSDSRIRWTRVVWIALASTLLIAAGLSGWLWYQNRTIPSMPSAESLEGAREELAGDIALLNLDGFPISSLIERCNAGSPDAIQLFVSPGFGGSFAATFLRGDRLSLIRPRQNGRSRQYVSADSLVSAGPLRAIWISADRIIGTIGSASAYPYEMTDQNEITVEFCKAGRYSFVDRYMGTRDPDNLVLSRFDEALRDLSGPKAGR